MAALRVPGGNAAFTRKELDDLAPFVAIYGAKGLAYIRVNDRTKPNEEGLQSPIVKFFKPGELAAILERTGAQDGDVIFFGADRRKVVNDALGALRAKVGHEKGHAEAGWRPCWVLDFPAYEYDEEGKRWLAAHHPFTEPEGRARGAHGHRPRQGAREGLRHRAERLGDRRRLGADPPRGDPGEAVQDAGHRRRGARAKFGFLLDALSYGAPPHGGIAFGFDRMVAMMAGVDQIRDVIAFPKTQRGQDLMVEAPSPVTEKQLRDLHIKLRSAARPGMTRSPSSPTAAPASGARAPTTTRSRACAPRWRRGARSSPAAAARSTPSARRS